jgi:hypothetical protein
MPPTTSSGRRPRENPIPRTARRLPGRMRRSSAWPPRGGVSGASRPTATTRHAEEGVGARHGHAARVGVRRSSGMRPSHGPARCLANDHPLAACRSSGLLPQRRLDVDHRRSVDGFDGPDAKAATIDGTQPDGMETQRVRPVRRSRRKHARQAPSLVTSRVDLADVPPSPMQPGDDEEPIAHREAAERPRGPRVHVQPGVGRPFRSLPGRVAQCRERRANHPDRS